MAARVDIRNQGVNVQPLVVHFPLRHCHQLHDKQGEWIEKIKDHSTATSHMMQILHIFNGTGMSCLLSLSLLQADPRLQGSPHTGGTYLLLCEQAKV